MATGLSGSTALTTDNVQPMIDYLDNGPPREVAEEIAGEIREALMLVAKSL